MKKNAFLMLIMSALTLFSLQSQAQVDDEKNIHHCKVISAEFQSGYISKYGINLKDVVNFKVTKTSSNQLKMYAITYTQVVELSNNLKSTEFDNGCMLGFYDENKDTMICSRPDESTVVVEEDFLFKAACLPL